MKYSKEEKAMWLEDWKQNGESAWKYAKENGLVPQTFVKWTQEEKESKSDFVEIPAQKKQFQQGVNEILIEKGDVKIHIPLTVDCSELRAVVESLGIAL